MRSLLIKNTGIKDILKKSLFPVTRPTHNLAIRGCVIINDTLGIKSQGVWSFPVATPLLVILSMRFNTQSADRWQMGQTWPALIRDMAKFLYTTRPTDFLCEDTVGDNYIPEIRYFFFKVGEDEFSITIIILNCVHLMMHDTWQC